jgi:DNA modification methylase
MMIPARLALKLQEDGWYLRSEIIWSKPNPMPESVTDRPTKAHEAVYLLAKSVRYYFDQEAVREKDSGQDHSRSVLDGQKSLEPTNGLMPPHGGLRTTEGRNGSGRNIRSVWTIPTQPTPEAHFATFPEKLVEPCIKAGSREMDLILDPFTGSGITGKVALELRRNFVGIELNPKYLDIARKKISRAMPLFSREI